ncbi:MAG: hypothetical protein QM500_04420 [Methylococcales bacterium]
MIFKIQGPYELDRKKGLIDSSAEALQEYWEWVDKDVPGLPDACGCYVFAIQASRGLLPWYIGKSEKQAFKKECLSHHKINHFNNAIAERRGIPLIFFVPQLTKTGRYRKPSASTSEAISDLKALLIGMALTRNSALLNIKDTTRLKTLVVDGFLNSKIKARGGPAGELRQLLGG